MVAPVLLGAGADEAHAHGGHVHDLPSGAMGVHEAALAITVHVGAMLAVMAVVALVVYEKAGRPSFARMDQLRPVLGHRVRHRGARVALT